MATEKPSTKEILKRAKRIVNSLAGLQDGDGLWVLYTAINFIVMRPERTASPGTIQPVNVNLRPRRRGPPQKMDSDPELRAFIHGLDRYLTVKNLRETLVNKFGESRTPSENTLSRYLQRLAQSNT